MRLFRSMLADERDGLPLVGRGPKRLGVRLPPDPHADVRPDPEGSVHPGAGGLSVAADSLMNLPRFLRPRRLPGSARSARVYEIASEAVGEPRLLRAERPPHHLVEPAASMPLVAFEAALGGTRPSWREVP